MFSNFPAISRHLDKQANANAYVFSRLDDPGDGTEQDLRKRYDVHLDDKNVAYLVYRPESFEKDGPFLSGLYVSPDHRNKGLAKKLLTMLERDHKGKNIRLLANPYKDKNMTTQELVAMYKHLGFKSDNEKRPARMSKQAAANIVELLKQKGIDFTNPAQDPTKRGIFGQLRRSFAEQFKPVSNPVNISTLLPELGKPRQLFQPNQLLRRPFESQVEKVAISTNAIMRAAQKAKSRGVPAERLQKYWNTFDGWSEEANKRYWNSLQNEVKNNSWQKSNWFSTLTDMFKRRKAKKSVITQLKQRGVSDPGDIGMHLERKTSYPVYSHRYAADLDPADNLPEQAKTVRDIFAPFNWDTLFHEAGHAADFGTSLKPNMRRTVLSPLGPPTKQEYWKAYREQLALDNPLSDVFTDHASTLRREANAWRFGNQMMRGLDLARNRRMREIGTSTYELNLLREMRKNLNNNSATELQSSMPFLPAKFRRALDTMPGSTSENLIPQKQASTKDNSVLRSLIQAKSHSDHRQYKLKKQVLLDLIRQHPEQFVVDSKQNNIVGLTHRPTGFKIHAPADVATGISASLPVANVNHEKVSSVGTLLAASLLPRLVTSVASRIARHKNSPLANYYAAMHQKGFQHGLDNKGEILPKLRRPLLSTLGTLTGFADYELGLQNALQLAKQMKNYDIPEDLVRNATEKYQQHMSGIDGSNSMSPLLRYSIEALKGPKNSRIANWLERKFMSNKPNTQQGKLTTGLGALRTGITEAALSPFDPLTGFLRGTMFGALESLPEAVSLSALSRGYMDPVVGFKGALMRHGIQATQGKPNKFRIGLQNIFGAFDSNADEVLAMGRDLGRLKNQQGISGYAVGKGIDALNTHTAHTRPIQQLLAYTKENTPKLQDPLIVPSLSSTSSPTVDSRNQPQLKLRESF